MLTCTIMVKASKMGRVLSDREGKVVVLGNTTAQLRVATGDAPPCQDRTASLPLSISTADITTISNLDYYNSLQSGPPPTYSLYGSQSKWLFYIKYVVMLIPCLTWVAVQWFSMASG